MEGGFGEASELALRQLRAPHEQRLNASGADERGQVRIQFVVDGASGSSALFRAGDRGRAFLREESPGPFHMCQAWPVLGGADGHWEPAAARALAQALTF